MIVAHRATGRQRQPSRRHRAGPIDRVSVVVLRVDRSTFARRDIASVEPSGNELIERRFFEEITRELLDGKLIEGQIPIEALDDPIAISPHLSLVVQMQAVGIGIASDIEPVPGHLLAIAVRLQVPIHHFLISLRRGVGQVRLDLLGRRRQPSQRKGHASDQSRRAGLF